MKSIVSLPVTLSLNFELQEQLVVAPGLRFETKDTTHDAQGSTTGK